MAKQKKQQCWVIFTTINGKKCYIESTVNRFNGAKVLEYTTDIEKAKPFLTLKDLQLFSDKIHNPYNRHFETEVTEMLIKEVSLPDSGEFG